MISLQKKLIPDIKFIKKFSLYTFVGSMIAVFVVIFNIQYPKILESFDGKIRDYMFLFRGVEPVDNRVVIVDIDEKEISPIMVAHIEYGCDPISKFEKDFLGFECDFNSKIIATIPTKNGWHLITKPFNRKQFSDKYPEIDVQINNPTLLYFEYED